MTFSQENKFKCETCGECCKTFRVPVLNKEEVIRAFEKELGFRLKTYKIIITIDGECEHLINNRCSIYEKRQELCKNFLCKKHSNLIVPNGQIYQKRCLICGEIRKFQKDTERDKQSICGNCWNWQ